jgi:hypothetical protein
VVAGGGGVTPQDDVAVVGEALTEACVYGCGCDDPGNPQKCIHANRFAALDRLAASVRELKAAEATLLDARRQMEELREQGMWPVWKVVAENAKLREALERIQAWDCLNPPNPSLCADHPWLRGIVDAALSDVERPDA